MTPPSDALNRRTIDVLEGFVLWLEGFGETSRDHQTFFAGGVGGAAKELYYRQPRLGLAAVAPFIACEALLPWTRRFFHRPTRFPIADAHYAMGFAFLYESTGAPAWLARAVHFLEALIRSRCDGYEEYCWGYPFDWVTRNGTIPAQTPLITSTPYVYEAFLRVYCLDGRERWRDVLASIVRHVMRDIKDFPFSAKASSCSYTPFDHGGVVNAAAYRAFMLTSAAQLFEDERCWSMAERNLHFVLEAQNVDGSWYYAIDGVRNFVDHFHTCFVMKALAKIHSLTGHAGCFEALSKGLDYYAANLFDECGLPRPFSRVPRLTVYRQELYDCAECINLCLLLQDRFPRCDAMLERVVGDVLDRWVTRGGSFRARRLFLGWDNVPMHRWAQSQMFRSLAFYYRERAGARVARPATAAAAALA